MLFSWHRLLARMLPAQHFSPLRVRKGLLGSAVWLLAAFAQFWIAGVSAHGVEICYWVWHRDAALTPKENVELTAQRATRLLWHVGTLRGSNGEWVGSGPLLLLPKAPQSIALVPVLRITPEHEAALSKPAAAALANRLLPWLRNQPCTEIQIDFDCPDRRLGEYAEFLREFSSRIQPYRLSATALADWARLPAFRALEDAVDALYPMFYDLQPDSPEAILRGEALPLLAYNDVKRDLERWGACRKPWYAGLPNFARVTLFDVKGASRGHLRSWDWDDICFSPHLHLQEATKPGLTSFRVKTPTAIADTQLAPQQLLVARTPARADLLQCVQLVEKLGAKGISFFRLPGEGAPRGWSLAQLGSLLLDQKLGSPSFQLKRNGDRLELFKRVLYGFGAKAIGAWWPSRPGLSVGTGVAARCCLPGCGTWGVRPCFWASEGGEPRTKTSPGTNR